MRLSSIVQQLRLLEELNSASVRPLSDCHNPRLGSTLRPPSPREPTPELLKVAMPVVEVQPSCEGSTLSFIAVREDPEKTCSELGVPDEQRGQTVASQISVLYVYRQILDQADDGGTDHWHLVLRMHRVQFQS